MNYPPIHTTVYPSYNYLSAENAYLRQTIEYRNHVLHEQQITIANLQADVNQLSQANMQFQNECAQAKAEAKRWQAVKQIMLTHMGERRTYEVQKIVDKEIRNERAGKKGLE